MGKITKKKERWILMFESFFFCKADAPISGHMYEFVLSEDIMNFGYVDIGFLIR